MFLDLLNIVGTNRADAYRMWADLRDVFFNLVSKTKGTCLSFKSKFDVHERKSIQVFMGGDVLNA